MFVILGGYNMKETIQSLETLRQMLLEELAKVENKIYSLKEGK